MGVCVSWHDTLSRCGLRRLWAIFCIDSYRAAVGVLILVFVLKLFVVYIRALIVAELKYHVP